MKLINKFFSTLGLLGMTVTALLVMALGFIKKQIGNIIFVAILACMLYIGIRYDIRFVQTGSMLPDIQIGAICFIDPDAYVDEAPQIEDVAMYSTTSRDVIHRIIDIDDDGAYIFQGDNNDAPDFSPVPREVIKGKVVAVLNFVAPLMRLIKGIS